MPFQPIVSQRLYQQVANQIGDLIRAGEFVAGQRLPPERDLAKLLGASRPVVREALVALEIAGLVEVRGGSGSYVKGPSDVPLTDAGPSPFDIVSARILIEGETVFAAASCASDDDLAGIVETVDTMRRQMADGVATFETDRLFHTRIAQATRNTVLAPIVGNLWDSQFAPMFAALSVRTRLRDNQVATLRDHARIADALTRHDAPEARAAMREHLTDVMQVLLREDDAID